MGTALCIVPVHSKAADKPVANPPPEDFLKTLDPQMLEVVDALLATKPKPIYELTAEEARRQSPVGVYAVLVAKKHGNPAKEEVGDLGTVVCLMAKERKGEMPVAQLLIYPVTDWKSERPSHTEYGESPTLPEKSLPWFSGMYFASPDDAKKPLASPIYSENLKGLPPATIINAQCDVRAADGAAYAEKLEAAGVPVKHEVYKGVTHEFFGMGLAVDRAKAAENFAGEQLKKAFASGSPKQE